jgi:prophage regulatory protein
VRRRTTFTSPWIWTLEKRGEFPQRVQLGNNAVAWVESEIDQWIENRIRAGGKAPKPAADGSRGRPVGSKVITDATGKRRVVPPPAEGAQPS